MSENLTKQEHIQMFRDMAKTIRRVLDLKCNLSDPNGVAEHLELLKSLLGTSAEMAAKAKYFYNTARMELYDKDIVKKSDSTGYIDSHISDEAYWSEYTENLQRNLKVSIDAVRTELSYLKNEREAYENG